MIDTPRYCDVELVQIGDRLRSLDPDKVAALAESMDAIGLQQPISVWSDSIDTLELVAGLHRLEAARKLGWEDIDCIFVDMDDLDRQLWEIDENLCRAELSKAERAAHIAKREELFRAKSEATSLQSLQRSPKPRHRPSKGTTKFVKDTAKKTRRSERSVWEDLKLGRRICSDVLEAIKDMPAANNGSELQVLTYLTDDEQREALEAVQSGTLATFYDVRHAYKMIKNYCGGPFLPGRISANHLNLAARLTLADVGERAERAGFDQEDRILKVIEIYETKPGIDIEKAAAEVIKNIRVGAKARKQSNWGDLPDIEITPREELVKPLDLFVEFLLGLHLEDRKLEELRQHVKATMRTCEPACKLKMLDKALRKAMRARSKDCLESESQIIDVPEDII